ncbi:MAG: sigma-54 interaction domain-containing protein [Emergencia sp.]
MTDMYQLQETLKDSALSGVYRKITGRNALIRDLFDYLFKRAHLSHRLMVLYTEKGLILSCSLSLPAGSDLSGYTIDPGIFQPYQQELTSISSLDGLVLTAAVSESERPLVNQLQTNLKMLLSIFDANRGREQYLLSCFDLVDNPICIYDQDACLLYGNRNYLKNMHIYDAEKAIGMNVLDITQQAGIRIHATKNGSSNLKMLDVLKSGRKALDWEVMIESETSAGNAQFVSNNMYPIKNKRGQIEGMIEIAYSHQLNLNKTKQIMGLSAEYTFESIIGRSPAVTQVIEQAKEYADSPYSLLIIGESGVGKELFAQAVHNESRRSSGPFVALNCANFPENLIESELFGYVGGAFTGASRNGQMGKFELADGGTLFLDEVGELPLHFQSKLLRVLETHRITRIGSSAETPVNVRILAATNRDLLKMIDEGLFRRDLYYRLQVLSIEVPPLRERREDIPLLAESFLQQSAEASGNETKTLDYGARRCLMEYDWPGNVRELKNVIQRSMLLTRDGIITEDVLEAAIYSKGYALKSASGETSQEKLKKCFGEVDRAYENLVRTALNLTDGNKKKAAEMLGVSRQTFYRMMDKYL